MERERGTGMRTQAVSRVTATRTERRSSNGAREDRSRSAAGAGVTCPIRGERSPRAAQAMIVAAADAVAEDDRVRLSAATIITRAGVRPRTFHAAFGSVEACLLAAFEEGLARATHAITAAVAPGATLLARVEKGLSALLRFLNEEPGWGRLLVIELPEQLRARRERTIAALARAITESQPACDFAAPVDEVTARRLVAEVLEIVASSMRERQGEPLLTLAPWLMSTLIEPTLESRGRGETLGTCPRAPSKAPAEEDTGGRTGRTLRAVAYNPGANNREIAQASGVPNDSYVSELLGRLQRRGLIENLRGPCRRGHANAWVLTAAGEAALAEEGALPRGGRRAAA